MGEGAADKFTCLPIDGLPVDARLIACAPELLAIARRILWCEDHGDGLWDMDGGIDGECSPFQSTELSKLLEVTRAVIAKATGEAT